MAPSEKNKFGIYVHLPFCIQKCSYCDFATAPWNQGIENDKYISHLLKEIENWSQWVGPREVTSLYFGGGTPSLSKPESIVAIVQTLEKHGFPLVDDAEIGLEADPKTIDKDQVKMFRDHGVNRLSLGIQTFDDSYLEQLGRFHRKKDAIELLEWIDELDFVYTADILFALPNQDLGKLKADLDIYKSFSPKHLSAYVLTLPEKHRLMKESPEENLITEMFELIREELSTRGLQHYEISNYAVPGYEAQHNTLYWTNEEYWGLGMSAHSYLKRGSWGKRLWRPSGLSSYYKFVNRETSALQDTEFFEDLDVFEALFDRIHTALRMLSGFHLNQLMDEFPRVLREPIMNRFAELKDKGLVEQNGESFKLTRRGLYIFNKVLEILTFTSEDRDLIDIRNG